MRFGLFGAIVLFVADKPGEFNEQAVHADRFAILI